MPRGRFAALGAVALLVACSESRPEAPRAAEPTPEDVEPAAEPRAAETPRVPAWERLDPPAAPGALGVSLVATSDGVLGTWVEPAGEAHRVRLATLRSGSWSSPTTVAEGPDLLANWADFPRAERAPDGAIHVAYFVRTEGAPHAYDVHLARSADGGATFAGRGVLHRDGVAAEHGFVSLLPEGDGVRAFWLDGRDTAGGGATAIHTALVADEVGPDARLDPRTCDCCQTDAALGPDGAIVVYRDRADAREVRDVAIVRRTEEGFTAPSPVHADDWEMAGCPVNGPAVSAAGARVTVAWFTGADGGSVRASTSDDGGATFGEPVMVDPGQPPGRVDVARVDGGAAVSWLARGPGGGEVRVRFVGDDGALGASTVVASTGTARAVGFPVLAKDGGRLVVGWRDGEDPPRIHVATLPTAELPRGGAPGGSSTGPTPTVAVGESTAGAHVLDADGARVALSRAAGGPAVVAFFARWCQPCGDELAQLERLRGRLPDGVALVAVSLDEGPASRAEATARGWGFSGPVLRDSGAAAALGIPPLPGLVVLDADGALRRAWRGEALDDGAHLEATRAVAAAPNARP